ncbi:pyridoxal-phosphate dependent enzyme [Spirochaeta lutea]|uniref:Threonine synthase n=1 Tax=Spirochaeta lutea TaxID=1480694 RepID=A0A098R0K6_9SPIO|nr:pyridoxal-phosphate dependent enzyme [Spirochaeta lutea]KGE73484.1 threonine synthase [Spirochaeta lutea]
MQFVSTRGGGKDAPVGFRQAVFQGLAPDGGLYHPLEEPDLSGIIRGFSPSTSFTELAFRMTRALFSQELTEDQADQLCRRAFPFEPALSRLGPGHLLLELFHGPSCAFKDFGASYLANVMQTFLDGRSQRAIILTATSGDTGSAVAQAFHGKDAIDVVILYPSGRVSPSQEQQLTTLGGNVHALEVQGSFDDCQSLVKQAFTDPALSKDLPLTSANSINLGRLIPQSFYYLWAASRDLESLDPGSSAPGTSVRSASASGASSSSPAAPRPGKSGPGTFCVPSGNFGNLTAGILARRWGMAADGFIAATNANDVVPQYLETGDYQPRPSIPTHANAMDVGSPSNFERMSALFQGDFHAMARLIRGESSNNQQILDTMKDYYQRQGVYLCPHTAAGVRAGDRALKEGTAQRVITLATAHPAKFPEIARLATGTEPAMPQRLADVMSRTKQATLIDPTLEALGAFLRDSFRS